MYPMNNELGIHFLDAETLNRNVPQKIYWGCPLHEISPTGKELEMIACKGLAHVKQSHGFKCWPLCGTNGLYKPIATSNNVTVFCFVSPRYWLSFMLGMAVCCAHTWKWLQGSISGDGATVFYERSSITASGVWAHHTFKKLL